MGAYAPLKRETPVQSTGHRPFVRLAAAYCLASYSYDLLVSSDSDFIF